MLLPRRQEPSVRARSTCRSRGGRAAAVPPFSGPRSRASVAACNPQPHHHRCALQPWGATANRACARGHHHRPDSSGVACHAFASYPGARATCPCSTFARGPLRTSATGRPQPVNAGGSMPRSTRAEMKPGEVGSTVATPCARAAPNSACWPGWMRKLVTSRPMGVSKLRAGCPSPRASASRRGCGCVCWGGGRRKTPRPGPGRPCGTPPGAVAPRQSRVARARG